MEKPLYNVNAVKLAARRVESSNDNASILSQEIIARSMERLELMTLKPQCILDVGSGMGLAMSPLKKRFPDADVMAVDFSLAVLKAAKHDLSNTVCADSYTLPFKSSSVDMVFANLVLPWLNDPELVFKEWSRVLKPEGLLMFTGLGPDTLCELREAFSRLDDFPHVHPFLDMHDVGDALMRAKLSDPVMDVEHITLHYRSLKTLFSDLKAQGMQNVLYDRFKGLTTASTIQKIQNAYECYRGEDEQLPVTCEVVYGHAWGVPISHSVNERGEVSIPVSAIGRSSA